MRDTVADSSQRGAQMPLLKTSLRSASPEIEHDRTTDSSHLIVCVASHAADCATSDAGSASRLREPEKHGESIRKAWKSQPGTVFILIT